MPTSVGSIGNVRESSRLKPLLQASPGGAERSLLLLPPVDRPPVLHAARLDLDVEAAVEQVLEREHLAGAQQRDAEADVQARGDLFPDPQHAAAQGARFGHAGVVEADLAADPLGRAEGHPSERQSLMRISYAVF